MPDLKLVDASALTVAQWRRVYDHILSTGAGLPPFGDLTDRVTTGAVAVTVALAGPDPVAAAVTTLCERSGVVMLTQVVALDAFRSARLSTRLIRAEIRRWATQPTPRPLLAQIRDPRWPFTGPVTLPARLRFYERLNARLIPLPAMRATDTDARTLLITLGWDHPHVTPGSLPMFVEERTRAVFGSVPAGDRRYLNLLNTLHRWERAGRPLWSLDRVASMVLGAPRADAARRR